MPLWSILVPLLSALILAASGLIGMLPGFAALAFVALVSSVLAAVHHAETVAHKLGEPFGTLILALAVTAIEVALIIAIMLAGGDGAERVPRDTIFSAVMIISTGVVGLCLLIGGMRHREQSFRVEGACAGISALFALSVLSLVLPTFTTSSASGTYTNSQLAFAAVASLALWGVFVFIQTVRHRDYFLPREDASNEEVHAEPPTAIQAWAALALLLVALVVVVGLAKMLSPTIERGVAAIGAPKSVIGVVIALLVLLPETWAAIRAARANRIQTSLNLAIGSALASIGLTIPAVVGVAVVLGLPLRLGLEGKDLVFLGLAFGVSTLTMSSGRTNVMQGAIHLVIFAAFLFMSVVP